MVDSVVLTPPESKQFTIYDLLTKIEPMLIGRSINKIWFEVTPDGQNLMMKGDKRVPEVLCTRGECESGLYQMFLRGRFEQWLKTSERD